MDPATKVQILDEASSILNITDLHEEGMIQSLLPPQLGQTKLFNLGTTTSLGEGKT